MSASSETPSESFVIGFCSEEDVSTSKGVLFVSSFLLFLSIFSCFTFTGTGSC